MKISSFRGDYAFLSNFYPAPVHDGGMWFAHVEGAYQAAKASDQADRVWISRMTSPGAAKRAGRKVALRKDGAEVRVEVMMTLGLQKFRRHEKLAEKLKATGTAYLEEGNSWGDQFWGVCGGEGKNVLGHILMEVREILRVDCPKSTRQAAADVEAMSNNCPF